MVIPSDRVISTIPDDHDCYKCHGDFYKGRKTISAGYLDEINKLLEDCK